jgi:hypothetical protein
MPGLGGTWAMIAQNLGVTAVELLPVHAPLMIKLWSIAADNYWGYNTIGSSRRKRDTPATAIVA